MNQTHAREPQKLTLERARKRVCLVYANSLRDLAVPMLETLAEAGASQEDFALYEQAVRELETELQRRGAGE